MATQTWKQIQPSSFSRIARKLAKTAEWEHTSLTEHLLAAEKKTKLLYSGRKENLIMAQSNGFIFPRFHTDLNEDLPAISPKIQPVHTIMGLSKNVDCFCSLNSNKKKDSVDYFLMHRSIKSNSKNPLPSIAPPTGFSIRVLSVNDAKKIMPLELAYQQEEVILPGQSLPEQAIRLRLSQILKSQVAIAILENGKPVAKANTNARGIHCCQIGGVYTLPEYRKMGLAACAVSNLMHFCASLYRFSSLFVKRTNTAGIKLYRKLDFTISGDYTIAYA